MRLATVIAAFLITSSLALADEGEKVSEKQTSSNFALLGRTERIASLRRSQTLPLEAFEVYRAEIRSGKTQALRDLIAIDIWDARLSEPLLQMFADSSSVDTKLHVLETLRRCTYLSFQNRKVLLQSLRTDGYLTREKFAKSKRWFEVLSVVGDSTTIEFLASFLNSKTAVPHPIGLSQPNGRLPPPLRICDCAHDAIVKVSGGSLEARVAKSFERVGITNEFDPRRLFLPEPPGASRAQAPGETVDTHKINSELYAQVMTIRDDMLLCLRNDLRASGLEVRDQ